MKNSFLFLVCLLASLTMNARQTFVEVNTDKTSLIMVVDQVGALRTAYYGVKGPQPSDFVRGTSATRSAYGGQDMAYSTQGGTNAHEPALKVRYADGYMNTELYYESHETSQQDGCTVTKVLLKDPVTALEVTLVYEAFTKEDVIRAHAEILNGGKKQVELLNFYSSHLSLNADRYLLTSFHGEWGGEMQVESELLGHGRRVVEATQVTQATERANPSFILSLDTEKFDENNGNVIAGSLAWSGNFSLSFQVDEWETLNILAGINPSLSSVNLSKGESFCTPDMIWTFSSQGVGQASRNLHDYARNYGIYQAWRHTPTLLNSWEGAYFDFNTAVIKGMIDDTAEMGLEMFVLDDGWFGTEYPRDNAKQGLGDWEVNTKKLPEGIDYLAQYAHEKGIKFGIWIEPEMVNPRSRLAQEHPEWVVRSPGRETPKYRNQWSLDLSNPKVQDFVFGVFDGVMKLSDKIDYIKWDCNKTIMSFGSDYLGQEQNEFCVRYVQGFYAVMERIRQKYPDVMIQCCSSGGGRVEYGALKYFNEFWTSDNTDGLSRAKIQYGTGLIFPAQVIGSHVSAVPNHQTGNVVPLKFRFDMASSGRLGMELQPKNMSQEDREFAKRAIASYDRFRDLVFDGDLYRIDSPYESDFSTLMYVSKDKKKAVLFAFCLERQHRHKFQYFPLKGLDPSLDYHIEELNVDKSTCADAGHTLTGATLVNRGLEHKMVKKYTSSVFLLTAE